MRVRARACACVFVWGRKKKKWEMTKGGIKKLLHVFTIPISLRHIVMNNHNIILTRIYTIYENVHKKCICDITWMIISDTIDLQSSFVQ